MIVRTTWEDRATGVTHEVAVDLPPAQFSRRLARMRGYLLAKDGWATSCDLPLSGVVRVDPHAEITCEDGCGLPAPHPLAPRRIGPSSTRRVPEVVGAMRRTA